MRPRFFRRKGFVVHRAADIAPLLLRVLFHWKVPRIEIDVAGLPLLDAQRSQLRLRRLNEILERQTGGLVAIAGGLLFVVVVAGSLRRGNPATTARDAPPP